MLPKIETFPLPAEILIKIGELAEGADALFFGEIHGTQEIPQIISGLLPMLHERGYRGLGLEVPQFEQENLRRWLSDPKASIPDFYAKPGPDGRGSREMLAIVLRASQMGFQVFCFDPGLVRKNAAWTDRDAGMAQITQEIWQNDFPKDKILLICGNNHAFLKPPPQAGNDLWPSFSEQLRQLMPAKQYRAVDLMPVSGEFYNMGIRNVQAYQFLTAYVKPLEAPRLVPSDIVSMQVDFPQCHAATFFSTPKTPGQWKLVRLLFLGLLGNYGEQNS